MYTAEGLLEFSTRAHQSFSKLLEHCRSLTNEEFVRELYGFGYPTVQLQLHHAIGAQKYWVGVIEGRMDVDDDPGEDFTIDNMIAYQQEVIGIIGKYLKSVSTEDLITACPMTTWGNVEKTLIPAHIVIRTLTHLYNHHGQVAAMCRTMNKPIAAGMDYPILP